MATLKEALCTIIPKAKPDENLVALCFQLIDRAKPDEKAQLLATFFQKFDNRCWERRRQELLGEGSESEQYSVPQLFNPDEKNEYVELYGKSADDYMATLEEMGLPEEEFYSKLWEYLRNPDFCENTKICAAILYNWAIDARLPYIDTSNALRMENNEFRHYIQLIGDEKLGRLRTILNSKQFQQRTERAALALQMLESIPDYKMRCVFMAQLIQRA